MPRFGSLGVVSALTAGAGAYCHSFFDQQRDEGDFLGNEVEQKSDQKSSIQLAKEHDINVENYQHPMSNLPWYWQWFHKIKRVVYLSCLFVPCASVSLAAYLTNIKSWKEYSLDMLVSTIEAAGCTFQKYGQWVSNRPDMFPQFLVEAMQKLCSHAPMHSEALTRAAFKESFGAEIEDIFEEFDLTPIASGTVAQVYRAKLKPEYALEDGTVRVAVKVRHPHVMQETFYDVDILYHFINLGSWFYKAFSVPFDRAQFVNLLQKQVDLTCEALNLQKFKENFASETQDGALAFPSFSDKFLSESVLVEGWATGKVLEDFFDAGKHAIQGTVDTLETLSQNIGDQITEAKRDMAVTIFDTAMKMFLRDNLMHGDLHAGNVMYNTETESMTVIDAGITCALDGTSSSENFVKFLHAMCTAKGEQLSESLLGMADAPPTLDREQFDLDIQQAIEMFMDPDTKRNKRGDGPVPVGDITGEVFRTLQRHQVYLHGDVTSLLMSIAMLEGLIEQLDPEFDMMAEAIPYIVRYKFDAVASIQGVNPSVGSGLLFRVLSGCGMI